MSYTKSQLSYLVILRMLIGWHFLYEGIVKVWSPEWSAKGYLMSSEWIFKGIFQAMAEYDGPLLVIDFLNAWGLTIIGLFLVLGFLDRGVAVAGAILLGFYYLAHPPLIGLESPLPTEGSYLFVNKNLIELFALLVLSAFPTGHLIGVDYLIDKFRGKGASE